MQLSQQNPAYKQHHPSGSRTNAFTLSLTLREEMRNLPPEAAKEEIKGTRRLRAQFANGTCAATPLPAGEGEGTAAQRGRGSPGGGTLPAAWWMHVLEPTLDPVWDAYCWMHVLDTHV